LASPAVWLAASGESVHPAEGRYAAPVRDSSGRCGPLERLAGRGGGGSGWDSSANGALGGQEESIAPRSEAIGDEQTLADREQTLADTDQSGSDGDQTASDSDQAAADCDQEASDRDLVQGGDPGVHDITRDIRDRSAQTRHDGAERRIDAGADRDAVALDGTQAPRISPAEHAEARRRSAVGDGLRWKASTEAVAVQ
jgi:hypothetical protein